MPVPLSQLYILDDDKQVRPATSFKEWKLAFIKTKRTVLRTDFEGGRSVHTFFTGFNRDPGRPIPLVFQTVLSGGPSALRREYATYGDAWHGHAVILEILGRFAGKMAAPVQAPLIRVIDGGKDDPPETGASERLAAGRL